MGISMKSTRWLLLSSAIATALVATAYAQLAPPSQLTIAQKPLFVESTRPPLNMLVMGKDHKNYYEAYNDASDLDGDGGLDVGYQGWQPRANPQEGDSQYKIDYYGYFDSYACYSYQGLKFVPVSHTDDKTCSGAWSGDYLNYLTTSRMDALRRVLYGGWRQVDTASETVLQGAFFPQDAHSWGKEYKSIELDGFNISDYAPLSEPEAGKYHLFAVTTVTDNSAPLFRVLRNTSARVWNWLSIEGPVAGNKCFNASNTRVDCIATGGNAPFPGHPGSRSAFDQLESTHAISANLFGSGDVGQISCSSGCNPYGSGDEYLTIISGEIGIRNGRGGEYQFRVDGDDVIDFTLTRQDGTQITTAACYDDDGRGFGTCGGNEISSKVQLSGGRSYKFKFRHEEGSGGDGYKLEWRKTGGGETFDWREVTERGSDANGNGDFADHPQRTTYDLTPPQTGSSGRDDYRVRVQVCPSNAELQDGSCKTYPNGNAKPTGILHDYGESEKMYFGLITGSQRNNLEGGILRRNVSNFRDEIEPTTGVFRADVDGIAHTIDGFRMVGGGYNGGVTNNIDSDANWSWNGGSGSNCDAGTIGGNPLVNGQCRMWGNPIAEMMYESMRYFAGAAAATTRFATGGSASGAAEAQDMGLPAAEWKDPYASVSNGGLGYATCSKPFQTVISDINPSYDGDLPGSVFSGANTSVNDTPSAISGFSASAQGQTIWNAEFGVTQPVFIGEVAGVTDGAPTAKSAASFGNIRGLSPEEPTKRGTYYSASVGHFGRINDINAAGEEQSLSTFAVALASPLPRIVFPAGDGAVTLLPFAKTASGTFGGGTLKPTNTIVDFYVEKIVNLPGQPYITTENGGRPYAVFRINYEDVEQGNDHDMDAIVRYEVKTNEDGTLTVTLNSEYAAGSADQNIGYVISGTTKDGVYLEVRDRDSNANSFRRYDFNTPPGFDPGECAGVTTGACNTQLPLLTSRNFVPAADAADAIQLQDPLWYAAKYGGFIDANGDGLPQTTEWDNDADGVPDNYFLVTNPLQLRDQLTEAFDAIQAQANQPSGALSVSGARLGAGSFTVTPSFSVLSEGTDWVGDLRAFRINSVGSAGDLLWSAADEMPSTDAEAAARNILTSLGAVDDSNRTERVVEFRALNLGGTTAAQFGSLGYGNAAIINIFGGSTTPDQMVTYLRGATALEGGIKGVAPFRERSSILGDIVNSTPVIASANDNFGWASAEGLPSGLRTSYEAYLGPSGKGDRPSFVYVGANDGMLHAFNGSTVECNLPDGTASVCATARSGEEEFAYIPNSVLGNLGLLADPEYTHHYYVDGGIAVSDVHDGSAWTTVLAGSSGAGGKGVFGLNIADPTSFDSGDVLWEINETTPVVGPDVGHVMGAPVIVPLDEGRWVALFGNGYNSINGRATLLVVDMMSGLVIDNIVADDGVNTANGLGNIAAIDTDGDGLVDTVYGGDLHGNVWKFDFGTESPYNHSLAFNGSPLFVATDADGARQPITSGLEVSAGPGSGVSVFFGTGSYFQAGDHSLDQGQQVQSLYSIWDDGTPVAGDRDVILQQQSITSESLGSPATRTSSQNTVNYLTQRGWYLDLRVGTGDAAAVGERFIGTPRLQNGKVFFTTYVPLGDPCVPGGRNWLFSLNAITGAAAMSQVSLDPDGDPPACAGADCAGISLSDGAPIRDTSVIIPPPGTVPGLAGGCVPGTPGCATPTDPDDVYQRCTLIIRASGAPPLYLPRPCGRQSWRQVR